MKLIVSYLICLSLRAFFFKHKWNGWYKVANVIVWLHYGFMIYLICMLICMELGCWADTK